MYQITAKQNTYLTKKSLQASHPDNVKSSVNQGKVFFLEEFLGEENGKKKVKLGYGAGEWFIYPPHWQIPNTVAEDRNPVKHDFPNTKEGNIQRIISVCKEFDCRKNQVAYILATTRWETANTFMPVKEAYWLSEDWRRRNLRYYPYYGRGYCQLTWEFNYKRYGDLLDLPLVEKPNMVMDPDISAYILVHGSMNGVFTGLSLPQFVNNKKRDFFNARKVINGLDKAQEIANIATAWYNGNTLKDY